MFADLLEPTSANELEALFERFKPFVSAKGFAEYKRAFGKTQRLESKGKFESAKKPFDCWIVQSSDYDYWEEEKLK